VSAIKTFGRLKMNQLDLFLGILQKLSIILGAVLGLIWFKLRYTKRDWRIHARLKLNVDGEIVTCHGVTYILILSTLENVGQNGYKIMHDDVNDTYVCIYSNKGFPQADTTPLTVHWDEGIYFEVFQNHTWLSPGEVVKEQLLVEIPESDAVAFKLEVGVITNKSQRPWKDEKIIFKELVSPSRVVGTVLQLQEGARS
jgi:hypothetical protein